MSAEYSMTVDLNVLEHLGINLYSNIAAVLTEVVANAWDADAETVEITVDMNSNVIEITDDGIGMSIDDLNQKYLRVGYRRREEESKDGEFTAKGRPIMGRKGLGKLSLFSIANVIEVRSAKCGQPCGFRMSTDGIRESAKKTNATYHPDPLPSDGLCIQIGTRITLHEIKRQRLGPGINALRKRLARRFSVIGEKNKFNVKINGQPITIDDRGDLKLTQFLWTIGEFNPDSSSLPNLKEKDRLPDRLESWDADQHISGWIGTARLPRQLDDKDAGNLNSIVLFSKGRLFHENILDKVNDGRIYTKYLTGQIEANFLDESNLPDIATSDRQRIQEDDSRYEDIIEFLKSSLSRVEARWTELRRIHEVKEAKRSSPALVKWFDTLESGHRETAEALIARLSALPVDNEDDKKHLFRHGILAFERMKIRGSTADLVSSVYDVHKLLEILADRDALEAALYRDIVKSRLEVISKFQEIVDEDRLEKVLQEYLFDHLWLLDPAWERAAGSELMESRLMEAGVIVCDLEEREKLKRVDIAYRTYAGKHIIVELKKAKRKMKLNDLTIQGQGYVDKLRKILAQQGNQSPSIEVVFVLGKPVNEEAENPSRLLHSMESISAGSKVVHYDSLIQGALNSYEEYLKQSKHLDRLESIVADL